MEQKVELIIKGNVIDDETRCIHYHSATDIIAIKFKCCNTYYPCFDCHKETTNHLPLQWQQNEFDTKAILCGVCKFEMSINEYLTSKDQCINCHSSFNPKCSNHYHLYFAMD